MTSPETLAAILLWLAALLAVARAGGRLAEVARQPAVLGELLAGIAAGALPTVDKRAGLQALVFLTAAVLVLPPVLRRIPRPPGPIPGFALCLALAFGADRVGLAPIVASATLRWRLSR